MADIFTKAAADSLLKGKFILLMGDSNMRGIYKDILYLLHNNNIIPPECLRRVPPKRRWASFAGDKVLSLSNLDTAGRDYFEEREFKEDDIHVRFHFITRVYGAEMRRTLRAFERKDLPLPNILIINSCIWDLTRWGPIKEESYKEDLIRLFSRIRSILPEDSLIIWNSTLPISVKFTKGGLLVQQLEFVKYSLRFMILEANKFTQQLCVAFEIDFLDLHYHMRYQLHRRSIDGLHWEPQAFRHIVCVILTHISLALGTPLPGLVRSNYMKKCVENAVELPEVDDMNLVVFEENIDKMIKTELEKLSLDKMKETEISLKEEVQCQPKEEEEGKNSKKEERVKLNARRRNKTKRKKSEDNPTSFDLHQSISSRPLVDSWCSNRLPRTESCPPFNFQNMELMNRFSNWTGNGNHTASGPMFPYPGRSNGSSVNFSSNFDRPLRGTNWVNYFNNQNQNQIQNEFRSSFHRHLSGTNWVNYFDSQNQIPNEVHSSFNFHRSLNGTNWVNTFGSGI